MAKQEEEWVQRAWGKEELQRALKRWSATIRQDGRLKDGWKVRHVYYGGQPPAWDIYLIGPK